MNEPEPWTIQELDAVAEVTPPRGRGLPLASLALVMTVLVFAGASRTDVFEPAKTAAPPFSRNDSGTHLPSEAEIWGAIWSRAQGVAVLRPTWLPKSKDEYQVFPGAAVSSGGLFNYDVSYYELRSIPGTTAWHVDFMANSLDGPRGGFIQFGGMPESVTVRGHSAQLLGNGSPGWVLVWSEGDYRSAIQAFAVSREELLRIAESLAPVIDGSGRTSP